MTTWPNLARLIQFGRLVPFQSEQPCEPTCNILPVLLTVS